MEGIGCLQVHHFRIYGVVVVGMKGLIKALGSYPVQLCQFHQMMTIWQYLTQDPEIEASMDLLWLVNHITKMDKESFIELLINGT